MKDNEKLYKAYHRNYQTIEELFDDLSDAIFDISLENNRVIIHYNEETLEIEPVPLWILYLPERKTRSGRMGGSRYIFLCH